MKKYVIANWKMMPETLGDAKKIFDGIKKSAQGLKSVTVIVCPPFLYLHNLRSTMKNFYMGAQDVSVYDSGAHTGEVSATQLSDARVVYVIIGHSERRDTRTGMGESDKIINQKIKTALRGGLKVIFCVGERERGDGAGELNFVRDQLVSGLDGIAEGSYRNIILGYEPVWAISTQSNRVSAKGKSDSPEHAIRMAAFIRRTLATLVPSSVAQSVPIIYGGSIDGANAGQFLLDGWLSGLLVGGNSLKIDEMGEILKRAERA